MAVAPPWSARAIMIERLDYIELNPKAIGNLASTGRHAGSIDDRLRALVEFRVSQINGCVYCVDIHATQARAAGETEQRLDCLAAWRECRFFHDSERAALAWAEAVTLVADTNAPDALYDDLKRYYTGQQIVDLTLIVSLMNAWNRLAVSFRHLPDPRM